jgi:hypothetical protein
VKRHAARGTISRALLPGLALAALARVPAGVAQDISAGHAAAMDAAIRITSLTGSIRITAWPHESIGVQGRVDPGVGRFYIGGSRAAVKLGVETPEGVLPDGVADLDVRVPEHARLWIKSAAAEVEVTAGAGSLTIVSTSGRVRVAGHPRETSVETLDGNIELAFDGALARARSASGTIVVRGVIQDLDASTVSGPLLVGMEGKVGQVHLETVSGEIAFKGDLTAEGRLMADTHGGDIELRLPPGLSADWHLVSYGGGLHNEMVPPAAVHPGDYKGEWRFRTGGGGAVVDVRTFKGTVTLKPRGEPPPR